MYYYNDNVFKADIEHQYSTKLVFEEKSFKLKNCINLIVSFNVKKSICNLKQSKLYSLVTLFKITCPHLITISFGKKIKNF